MIFLRIKHKINFIKNGTFMIFTRLKNADTHWSMQRKKNKHTDRALANFDKFYGSLFGNHWESIRKALLAENHKYVAVINHYGDDEKAIRKLEEKGAKNMRTMFELQKKLIGESKKFNAVNDVDEKPDVDVKIDQIGKSLQESEIGEIYQSSMNQPETITTENVTIGNVSQNDETPKDEEFKEDPSLLKGLLDAEIDKSRIIEPDMGLRAGGLLSFIPATKIKGREDWLPESHQFSYYNTGSEFQVVIEEDEELVFPEHLQIYTYEKAGKELFPEPRAGITDVLNYYIMDGGSILPVLALNLKSGDRMIDLCAAPGGKTLVALQTLLPEIIIANDSSLGRVHRIEDVMAEYLYDYNTSNKWKERILITNSDAREIRDEFGFDKVLVDVPCTTDRHSLHENDNNIFRPDRVKERLRLPELQSDILCAALSLCKVGGTVVYSTCTLSPIQNDGVVHMGLKKAHELLSIRAKIMLLDNSFEQAKCIYEFGEGPTSAKYGKLVVPSRKCNFGPLYFSKMIRTQ